jgi:ATP-binding cassette subfamily B protein
VLVNLILNVFILGVSFLLMFTFFWKLALIMLLVIPFYLIVYIISDRLNKKVQRLSMERSADLESQLVESLNSARTLKMFGLEEYSNLRTEARFVSLLEVLYKSGLNIIFSSGSASILSQLITVIVLWTGAGFAINQELTPGELLSFYSVVGYFTGPVTTIIGFNRTLQDARIAADRLFEIFDLEVTDESGKVELREDMLGPITFENVKFRYGTRVDVFEGLNLIINQGEITAITGESGSGKTTLILLLQNLYPLQSGRIRIGKYDLNHLSVDSLRRMISVVPQKVDLFAGTILQNIALGELEPDIPKVLSVCDQLGMTSFIEQLPGGYNTLVGENGVCLSGGQQQRIAIARALYREPRILILDEATSSLDSTAEMFVKRTLELLKSKDITVILIAHRMSTISQAGRVIVLDKGKIDQDGSFDKLASEEGSLRKIIQQQTFLLDEEVKI